MNELPWDERVTMLSINPDAATREDVARMAAELVEICSKAMTHGAMELLREGMMRRLLESDSWCPACGHNRDKSSVSSIDNDDGTRSCQMCGIDWIESVAPPASPASGEVWVEVPREPTDKMCIAGAGKVDKGLVDYNVTEIYKAMLAAAQSALAEKEREVESLREQREGMITGGWRYRNLKTGVVTLTDQPPDRVSNLDKYEVTELFARNPAAPPASPAGRKE